MTTTTPKYALLFVEGERAGEAIGLDQAEITLGRSRQNMIALNDELLSRKHMVFRRLGDDLVLEDLDSAHGTFLNEKRLRGILSVQPGDMVVAGSQKIKVALYEEVAALAAESLRELDAFDEAAAAEIVPEDEDDKTRFGGEEDLDETRYHQAHDAVYDEEDDDAKTRVLADQATRMLDVDELQGLKAGKGEGVNTRKLAMGILLLVLLLGGGGYGLIHYYGGSEVDQDVKISFEDDQYKFSLTYPGIWEKTLADPNAAIVFEFRGEEGLVATTKVFADLSLKHETTGLSLGFQEYQEELKQRRPGYRLKGSKTLNLNGMRVIQYGYGSDETVGFGLFTYNGSTRYAVEIAVENAYYYTYKDQMLDVLGTFALTEEQTWIDFPLADEEIRHKALGSPQALSDEAWRHVLLARDLMTRRTVRLDNLHSSVDHYRKALQRTSALSQRPEFHEEVARELVEATNLLNEELNDQQFKITMAERTGDTDAVLFELSKLMRMVPDKNDPVYRSAEKQYKRSGGQ